MSLSWNSAENHVFLNPRLPPDQQAALKRVLEFNHGLTAHLFVLTSGTTASLQGLPKWVALSKSAFLASAEASNRHLASNASDTWLHLLPDFHVGGISILARAHLSGAAVVRGTWDVKNFVSQANEAKATLVSLVPAQIHDLVTLRIPSPSSIRAILVGGGALHESLYLAARELGWKVLPTYGMTETCSQAATAELRSLETCRYPELKILSHLEGRTSSPEGLLEFRGASLFTGYLCDDGSGPRLLDRKSPDYGWFRTEDRGEVSVSRHLRILGRESDRIKIGGESSDLARLRAVLEQERTRTGCTIDLALIDFPDARLERVIHLIAGGSLVPAVDEAVLGFNAKVLPFERIRKVHVLPVIPRTELGKLRRGEAIGLLT